MPGGRILAPVSWASASASPNPVPCLSTPVIETARVWFSRASCGGIDRSLSVATADIGAVAARTLAQHWSGRRVIEIEGPRRYSQNDIAVLLGKALGREVRAKAVPREQWQALFQSQGTAWPAPRMEMLDGFNSGWIDFEPGKHEHVTGTTPYETVLAQLARR